MKRYSDKVMIGGLFFNNLTIDEAVDEIEKRVQSGINHNRSGFVCFANQDTISRLNGKEGLMSEGLNGSFLTLADGASIVAAGAITGQKIKERVAGPDLMDKMIKRSSEKGYNNYFLGAQEGVASKMADNFIKKYPNLKICGIYSPPFGKLSDEENIEMIKMINQSRTDLLWVSFGCPKQELWILKNESFIQASVTLGVGAAFNFFAGTVKRAPVILQKIGFEWFYRLLQEPGRLFKRYFSGGFKFFLIILKQFLFKKKQ